MLAKPQQNAVKERVNLKKIISEVTALLETPLFHGVLLRFGKH
jgi:two-component system sporulation sensor kinase A